jgi:hypothetical protein
MPHQSEPLPTKFKPFIHDYTLSRFISTLDPQRLTPSDYQSLSGKKYVALSPHNPRLHNRLFDLDRKLENDTCTSQRHNAQYMMPHVSFVQYARDQSNNPVPFPDDTNGFFYYHSPSKAPPTAGHLRFRITPSADPASWSSGRDLSWPDNDAEWKLHLMKIVGFHPKLTAIRNLLLVEKLISHELVERCMKLLKWRIALGPHVLLDNLEQSFYTSFSVRNRGRFAIVGREEAKFVHLGPFFRDLRSRCFDPYTGKYMSI